MGAKASKLLPHPIHTAHTHRPSINTNNRPETQRVSGEPAERRIARLHMTTRVRERERESTEIAGTETGVHTNRIEFACIISLTRMC